jgi:hypothetical protein
VAKGRIGNNRFVEVTDANNNNQMLVVHEIPTRHTDRAVEVSIQTVAGTLKWVQIDEQGMRELFNFLGVLLHR